MQSILWYIVPLVPATCGLLFVLPPFRMERPRAILVLGGLIAAFGLTLALCLTGDGSQTIFILGGTLPLVARSDAVGRLFALLVAGMWLAVGVYSIGYMKHDPAPRRYFAFYFLTEAALLALCFSGTLVTMYLCFETMTLCSVPLVMHTRTKEAVAAGIKYLLYSIVGAMMGLFGIFYLTAHSISPIFTAGGTLTAASLRGGNSTLLWVVLVTMIGFGTKAGMFPMHGWLPTAHPVAPAPASAILSGVIVKSGVLCVLRVLYFVVGIDTIRGTWVQTVLLILALITIFMGSMLALAEQNLKKRLAYSTVSQISYILFGLFVGNAAAVSGGLMHVWFHSIIKTALFLCAGAIIHQTGKARVDELRGAGKRMPVTLWCFTLTGVGLIGIPPLCGFISKWYLAQGALAADLGILGWLGPVVLLVSALLTAAYLLPVSIRAFFPGMDASALTAAYPRGEAGMSMLVPMLLLAALTVLLGIWPAPLSGIVNAIAAQLT
ncbi:MAG: proton-conducting membrane transporter [Eubacteriales bacterium]|nr:proton-conducting membrane transporter [Eubacteriales bacterium]